MIEISDLLCSTIDGFFKTLPDQKISSAIFSFFPLTTVIYSTLLQGQNWWIRIFKSIDFGASHQPFRHIADCIIKQWASFQQEPIPPAQAVIKKFSNNGFFNTRKDQNFKTKTQSTIHPSVESTSADFKKPSTYSSTQFLPQITALLIDAIFGSQAITTQHSILEPSNMSLSSNKFHKRTLETSIQVTYTRKCLGHLENYIYLPYFFKDYPSFRRFI